MHRRHPSPLPRRWLMTDERMGDGLWDALARLPRGSGVVFRHYSLPMRERRALFERVRAVARRRRLVVVVGGPRISSHGVIARHGRGHGMLTAPIHSRREVAAAVRTGAQLLFVSPVYGTRSHPGARALGRVGLGLMIRGIGVPVVALGGMDERRWRSLYPLRIHGWAGIDGWLTRSKTPKVSRPLTNGS